MLFFKTIALKLGVDKAIAYSSGARIVQAFTGVGSIFFISTFLTGVEQGFYFTFGSILALQVFFELGLTGIMTQYVAHEASHLTLTEAGEYIGEYKYRSRLASLVHFCIKWYSVIAIVLFLFLIVVGFIYFEHFGSIQDPTVSWKGPWILISTATSIQLFVSPFNSILAGLGFVKQTSKISFIQQILIPTSIWGGLIAGCKLYVTGIGYVVSSLIWLVMAYKLDLIKVLTNLIKTKIVENVSYKTEIFPYQWKIALSWVSGYFIFQLFNPVLFATEGAVVAGQMGMTLTALNAIQAFSMSWVNTKIPLYSSLIAQKEYDSLDTIFTRTLKQMASICLALLTLFLLFMITLKESSFQINGNIIGSRFLDYIPMILMMIPVFLQQFTYSWATYLRCHKKEPFLTNSIVNGSLCMLSTIILGKLYGLYGIVLGYCFVQILLFPWGNYLYSSNKMKWHGR